MFVPQFFTILFCISVSYTHLDVYKRQLIESGNCQVYKEKEGNIKQLTKGDYFGEVALLNDLPRQATVEALDTVIVATLGKSGFQRLLGPAVEVLRLQDPTKAH